jgi:hypothetical protein
MLSNKRIWTAMSDQVDWEFAGRDDAEAVIRAAAGYLLKDASCGDRGEIVEIVHEVAQGLPPGQPDSLDDDMPGG